MDIIIIIPIQNNCVNTSRGKLERLNTKYIKKYTFYIYCFLIFHIYIALDYFLVFHKYFKNKKTSESLTGIT